MLNRSSCTLRSCVLTAIIAAGLLLVSCTSPTVPEVETDGGVVLERAVDSVRVRAFNPEPVLLLKWSGPAQSPFSVVVENVQAEAMGAALGPANDGATRKDAEVEVLTPTEIEVVLEPQSEGELRLELSNEAAAGSGHVHFAVVGDSQGRNDVLARIVEELNGLDLDFVVHLGDVVPSGTEAQYDEFVSTMKKLRHPFYTVVGNHDIKNEGLVRYESLLAPADYHFEWRSREFVFLNSAELELNGKQLQWFEELLAEGSPMVVFTHVPPEDPRGKNHGFVDAGAAQRFLRLVHGNSDQLRALFSGHVHIFDRSEKWGVPFVTSGGAGGPLYAAPKDGGFHHFTEVELSQAGLETTAVKVEAPGPPTDIVINGPEGDVVLPQSRLQELATVSGEAAFENRLDNIRGEGAYAGVPLSKLVALVGGMEENDTLVVQAVDGYQQHFSYCNVFPKNCGWADQQGQMILAVQFEGETVPEWETGYRIAFLPGDGVYDKEDCLQTSAPEQGCKVYDSAGARWVKNVVRLEVVK